MPSFTLDLGELRLFSGGDKGGGRRLSQVYKESLPKICQVGSHCKKTGLGLGRTKIGLGASGSSRPAGYRITHKSPASETPPHTAASPFAVSRRHTCRNARARHTCSRARCSYSGFELGVIVCPPRSTQHITRHTVTHRCLHSLLRPIFGAARRARTSSPPTKGNVSQPLDTKHLILTSK